ncbi:PulJ/GspJ family protein [Deinococcus misasensis]|uniref:PulJ/GspJ family protein n=1 Tax=Deinococcus misasensis TaxID=392413 RepID=UPI000AFCF8A0|nr:prepilin-type N-terminal cleavage/methylation domain-containing protein [Deinococcus misasensis]
MTPFQTHEKGFTLLEILMAMGIVGVLLTALIQLTTNVSSTSSDLQNRINATDATRRLGEVITQELRSSAFGVVANQPYPSGVNQISVLRPMATSGNTVAGVGVVPTASFELSDSITAYMGSLPAVPSGSYLVLLNGASARLMRTTTATVAGSTQVLRHAGCQNVLGSSTATLSLVTPVGFRYDPVNKMLYERRGAAAETIMAWNVSTFQLRYTYLNTSTGTETVSNTYQGQSFSNAGVISRLSRINLTLGITENGKTQQLSNTINLVSPTGLNINTYSECT